MGRIDVTQQCQNIQESFQHWEHQKLLCSVNETYYKSKIAFLHDNLSMKLIFLLLLVVLAVQQCPYCAPGSCTITPSGLSNCASCWIGALVKVQTVVLLPLGPSSSQTIGICQPCPRGCITCNYAVISPGMGTAFQGINCTSCVRAYTYNYATGFCSPCPANCIRCQCIMAGCSLIDCLACRPGYELGTDPANGHACVRKGQGNGRRLQIDYQAEYQARQPQNGV